MKKLIILCLFFYFAPSNQVRSSDYEVPVLELLTQKNKLKFYIDNIENLVPVDIQFSSKLNSLPSEQREEALQFIKTLDPIISHQELKAIVYYRFVSPSPEKLENALYMTMFRKFVLAKENYLYHYYSGNVSNIESWRHALIKNYFPSSATEEKFANQRPTFRLPSELDSIFSYTANHLANIKGDRTFKNSLITSEYITAQNIMAKVNSKTIHHYIDSIGPIPGNSFERISLNELRTVIPHEVRILSNIENIEKSLSKKHLENIEIIATKNTPPFILINSKGESPSLFLKGDSGLFHIKGPMAGLFIHRHQNKISDIHPHTVFREKYPLHGLTTLRFTDTESSDLFILGLIAKAQEDINLITSSGFNPIIADALVRKKIEMPSININILFRVPNDTNNFSQTVPLLLKLQSAGIQTRGFEESFPVNDKIIIDSIITSYALGEFKQELITLIEPADQSVSKITYSNLWNNIDKTFSLNTHDYRVNRGEEKLTREETSILTRFIELTQRYLQLSRN